MGSNRGSGSFIDTSSKGNPSRRIVCDVTFSWNRYGTDQALRNLERRASW
jgi:hypothetical protein